MIYVSIFAQPFLGDQRKSWVRQIVPQTQLVSWWGLPEMRLFMTLASRVFYYPSAMPLCLWVSVGKQGDAGAERRNYSRHRQWVMGISKGNKALFVRLYSSGSNAAAKQLPPNERFFSQVSRVIGDWWQICACAVCVDYQNMLVILLSAWGTVQVALCFLSQLHSVITLFCPVLTRPQCWKRALIKNLERRLMNWILMRFLLFSQCVFALFVSQSCVEKWALWFRGGTSQSTLVITNLLAQLHVFCHTMSA